MAKKSKGSRRLKVLRGKSRITSKPNFVMLPCQRCGEAAVPAIPLFFFQGRRSSILSCRLCEAAHFLSIKQRQDGGFSICYQPYTLRYPLEFYDDDIEPPIVKTRSGGRGPLNDSDNPMGTGPIVVHPRKRHFSSTELKTIWQKTNGRCHICGQRWRLNQRGTRGWHIDHVIPNIGGGGDTEAIDNFRIACAPCNLKKGRGYTEASIQLALSQLVETIQNINRQRTLRGKG